MDTVEVRSICTVRCRCKGCNCNIDEYVKIHLNFVSTSEKDFTFTTKATASVEDLTAILNKEGWAVENGTFLCPTHAEMYANKIGLKNMQHPATPIKMLGFSDDLIVFLRYITPSVEELLQTPPSDIYSALQKEEYLGLTYEFNTRLAELGIAVEGTRFVPPEEPDFWTSAPSPSIDAEQKLTVEEYDQLCLEEKYIAWFVTGWGHRFFSWRKERPEDWKESIDYIFDTFMPERFEAIKNICINRIRSKNLSSSDITGTLYKNARHLYAYQNVLCCGLKKCGLWNHKSSNTSLTAPLLQTSLIIDQHLSIRTVNALVLPPLRLHTLSDIFIKFNKIDDLCKVRGLGTQSIRRIIKVMEENGCRVENEHFKAPAYYLDDGCVGCPVLHCDALEYRGSHCAALRAKKGLTSDPALDLKSAIIKCAVKPLALAMGI